MAKTIAEIKKEYPVYKNIPDVELADKIYDKYYKGKIDEESYFQQVFPNIKTKPSPEKYTTDTSFQETLEYLPAGKELTVGRVGTGYEDSFKPTTEDIAISSGVSINNPATSKARFGASLGYNQEQKKLALKNTLSDLYEENIDVRIGPNTGELEYYNPKTKSYALVDKPGMDVGDFADMGGDAMVIIPDLAATIAVGVMTSGTAAVPAGAAAAFGGEVARLKLGQSLYGINKDLTNDQIIKKAAMKAGISLAAGYTGLGIVKFMKGTDNLLKGRLDMTDDLTKILDDKSKIDADLVAKQINEKLDTAKMKSKLKFTLAESLDDADMLATQSQFENVRRLGWMDKFRTAGRNQAEALNDYFKILKSGFNTGTGGKPINQFDAGVMIQDVIKKRNQPVMQNLINKQSQADELLTKATIRLPDGSARATGVEFRSVVDDLANTYKKNVDAAAIKLDEAAGVNLINTDEIAKALLKLSNKEKASLINAAKLENIFKPGVFEQLQETGGKVLIGDVRETMSSLASKIRDKETGSVTGETVDIGKLKFLKEAFKRQIKKDAGDEYLGELEKFNELVISGKQLLNNETIAKLTSISPQKQLIVANEDVFNTTFKKGIGSGQKAQAVFDVIKETPDAMKAYKDSIYELYKSKVFKNGGPNLTRHKQFMKDYEPALKVFFSETDFTKLNRIGGLKKQLDDLTKLRKETSDKLLKSFEGKLESLSPDELIRKIYKPNSLKEIRELKNILKNDPEVWKSFQRNVLTDLNERVKINSTKLGMKIINPKAFDNYINGAGGERGYRLALGEIFSKEFMNDLELLNKGLQVSGRQAPNAAAEGMVGSAFSDIIRARLGQFTLPGRLFTAARRIYKKGSERVIGNALLNPTSLKELVELRKLKPTSKRAAVILGKLGGYIFVRD
tara:strand:- start:43 stop:2769 length:2727 start_codon:yes stop_codon:yes gene_type:complete